MNECPKCGKNLALVGKVHNCVSSFDEIMAEIAEDRKERDEKRDAELMESLDDRKPKRPKSYVKDRRVNVKKRREYMREYMAKRRSTKQGIGSDR